MNSNITDFFRDPRLDNLDDPQQGAPQLDDAMDPPPPAQGKPPNKMLRIFSGSLTQGTTQLFPDDITFFSRVVPEGWIVRLVNTSNTAVTGVSITRAGGDDVTNIDLPTGPGASLPGVERVYKLPGPSKWLRLTYASGLGPALHFHIYAYTGYNPLDLI